MQVVVVQVKGLWLLQNSKFVTLITSKKEYFLKNITKLTNLVVALVSNAPAMTRTIQAPPHLV